MLHHTQVSSFFARHFKFPFTRIKAVSALIGIPVNSFEASRYGFSVSMKTLHHIPQTISGLYKVTGNGARHGFRIFL